MDAKRLLSKWKITPDALLDQFFLTDSQIIKKTVEMAEVNSNDVVLEIGAGIGNLTRELAAKAGKVVAYEVDRRFEPLLSGLPTNVEMHFESARGHVLPRGRWKQGKDFNKIVSNLPYSFAEQLLVHLTFINYDRVVLMVPKKLVATINGHGVFSSFFKVKMLMEVGKERFYPVPRTNSVLIDLIKLSDPIDTKDLALFLRQYVYQHSSQKVKNSLVEGLIIYYRLTESKSMTKNEARQLVEGKKFDSEFLEEAPLIKVYEEISKVFQL